MHQNIIQECARVLQEAGTATKPRAKHCSMPGDAVCSYKTQTITRCPTRTGPVARSVDCPIDFMHDQRLTCICKPGFGQAEVSDTSRLQMGGDCQAEQIRAEQDTTVASNATLGLFEGMESSRRLERLGRGMEEEEKLENETMQKKDLWEAWRNLRKLKKELLEKETNWQMLNTKGN